MSTTDKAVKAVQITVWRWSKSTVCLDWRLTYHLASGQHSGPQRHVRVLLSHPGELHEGDLTLLASRHALYMVQSRRWRVSVPRGLAWREVGAAGASVPPSGGEGGESSDLDELGTAPLPGLDKAATIISPPTPAKPRSASRRSRDSARRTGE